MLRGLSSKFLIGIVFAICIMQVSVTAQALQKGKPASNTKVKQSTPKVAGPPASFLKDTIYKDGNGKWVREAQYMEGGKINTIVSYLPPPVGEFPKVNVDTMNLDSIVVVVEKEYNLMYLLYKRKRIRQYRAVFGPDRLVDKQREGDRCTPEGWFKIVSIRDHGSWQKFMLLDYPTDESYKRFNERKGSGQIPGNSKIGGAIGIHGTFRGGDNMVDMGIGWTDGCVALKSSDIHDFTRFVKPGTRVYITKKPGAPKIRKKS